MKTFALKIAIIENYLLKLTKQVKTVMLSSEDLQIEVIIDNRFKEFSFDSYM